MMQRRVYNWVQSLMSFRLSLIVILLIAGSTIYGGRAADISIRPYYLERAAYERNASGQMVMFSLTALARRSDGAHVSIDYYVGKRPGYAGKRPGLRIVVMPDTSMTWLVDVIRSKAIWPVGSAEGSAVAKAATRASKNCDMGDQITVRELIQGVDTIAVTDSSNPVQQTLWYAPTLGCAIVQYRRSTDQGQVIAENRLQRLDLKEPDPRLFDLGEGYENVHPSELRARQYRAGGEKVEALDFQQLDPNVDREFLTLLRHQQ